MTVAHDGHQQVVAAADGHTEALGIRRGMPLTQARAIVRELVVVPADQAGDAAGLRRLAAWCLRYAPLVAADPPEGVLIDITGSAHLSGGEAALLRDLQGRLERAGFTARTAVADTPGAAHALARYGAAPVVVAGPGDARLGDLPVAALRLEAETVDALHRLGLERIGQVAALPRAPLARRFAVVMQRLDQALGRVSEPIVPLVPPSVISSRLGFVEPLLTAEAFGVVIAQLAGTICAKLVKAAMGARRLDLLFERVDGSVAAARVGTARPCRDAAHLGRLLGERLETVDPGLGVEAMRLVVSLAERMEGEQGALEAEEARPDIAPLVDRLANRLGPRRVYRVAPVESDVPERSVRRIPAMAPATGKSWPEAWPRPARVFVPQRIEALALLPDQPPAAFTWRRRRFRVRRADGPERVHGEWWRGPAEMAATRDYWRVEDGEGRQFWLYRSGDGEDRATGDLSWFLQGVF